MKFRNLVLKLHGAIGILMGLLLVVITLSGASIVFHEELDRTLNRSLWSVTPQATQISPDLILASVQKELPNFSVQSIRWPQKPDESYLFQMKAKDGNELQTFVDPYTGEVLGSRVWERSLIGFLYVLHHDLFVGKVGMIIVGIAGVSLLLMAITGAILWTGWRKLTKGFKVRWNAPLPLVSYDIHKIGGIVSNFFLLIISFTGVSITILHFLPMFNQPVQVQAALQQPPLAFSKLLRKADAPMPDGKTTYVSFSEAQLQNLTFRKKLPNQQTGYFDFSSVELNRYSGEVLKVNKVSKPEDAMSKLMIILADFHFGIFGGLPTRIFYMFIGFMPTVLLITGIITWQRRRYLRQVSPTLMDFQIKKYPKFSCGMGILPVLILGMGKMPIPQNG
ncbi:PepSY-associated TM helix domain-containing protein [Nostoc sp.]|uniref:PepSY-associated TM helix domain-containing protein n=1 Tax=Nostoc sp. TaxID=1180 RepID=UPI002FFB226D